MPERQLPERDPDLDPKIETPVIEIEDTHLPLDELVKEVEINLIKEDEKARKAVEEFAESVKQMPPD